MPMKLLQSLVAAILALMLSAPALAQDPATDKVKAELKKKLTDVQVDSVRKIAYGNLFEVTVGGELFYTYEKAAFLMLGSIFDLKPRENVTELRMRQLNRVGFATLPLDNAAKIVRGN